MTRPSRSIAGATALRRALLVPVALLALAAAAFPAPPAAPNPRGPQRVVLSGGCFWGMQDVFERLKGVTGTVVGYAGGSAASAQYETVSSGKTGHAESVEISYDPRVISFGTLLRVFFQVAHDPTELDRQGPDSGTQYRSAIFTTTNEQRRLADAYIHELDRSHVFASPIVTTVGALDGFYPAEAYHQHYADLHPDDPYIAYNDTPRVKNLRHDFPQLTR
jgi:peptide-methionine (S)-S-oxide reductase